MKIDCNPAPDDSDDRWQFPKSHRRRNLVALIALALVLVVGLVVFEGSAIEQYFGPPPVWHTFPGAFDSDHLLILEGCSLQDTLPGIGGLASSNIGSQTTITCEYHSMNYIGYVLTDCDFQPTGPIPSINGTLVPYLGCELSYAPLQRIFTGLFNVTSHSKSSIPVFQGSKIIVNITLASNLMAQDCAYQPSADARENGIFVCKYLGISYATSDIIQDCNFGIPIQVNGIPIPQDSCMADRRE